MVFELRGQKLIAVILLASGLDFLLFGCESHHQDYSNADANERQMIKDSLAVSSAAQASKLCLESLRRHSLDSSLQSTTLDVRSELSQPSSGARLSGERDRLFWPTSLV
jgi:hypothetical protein